MSIHILDSELEHPMEKLRKARCTLTQEDFARAIGIGTATYSRWLAADKPPKLSPDQLKKLCSLCKVDANGLLAFLTGEIDVEELQS